VHDLRDFLSPQAGSNQAAIRIASHDVGIDPPVDRSLTLHTSFNVFVRQFIGTVAASLLPVVLVAFCSIPFNLGGHPGEPRASGTIVFKHMT